MSDAASSNNGLVPQEMENDSLLVSNRGVSKHYGYGTTMSMSDSGSMTEDVRVNLVDLLNCQTVISLDEEDFRQRRGQGLELGLKSIEEEEESKLYEEGEHDNGLAGEELDLLE